MRTNTGEMKTITEILDDPRTHSEISASLEKMRGNKTWERLRRQDMLAPTSIVYQYKRQQAQESALPNWVKTDIWVIVSEAISDVIDMERTELKARKCKSLIDRLCNIVVTCTGNAEKECNKDVIWTDCEEIMDKLEHGFEELALSDGKSEVMACKECEKPCNNNVTCGDSEWIKVRGIEKINADKRKAQKVSNKAVTYVEPQRVTRLSADEVLEKARQGYFCPFNDDPCPYMIGEEKTVVCGECKINVLNNQKI